MSKISKVTTTIQIEHPKLQNNKNVIGVEHKETKDYEGCAVQLSKEECDKLIKEYMKIQNPTYYQINSFINIFKKIVFFQFTFFCYLGFFLKISSIFHLYI